MTRKRTPRNSSVRTASTTLQTLFQEMEDRKVQSRELADRAGLHQNSISEYRRGICLPNIMNVEAMVAAIGGRLVIVFD